MGFYGDSGGGGDLATYMQTISMMISVDSIEWAWKMLDKAGMVGEAISNLAFVDSDVVRDCATMKELFGSSAAMSELLKSSNAMKKITESKIVTNELVNTSVSMNALAASRTGLGSVFDSMIFRQAVMDSSSAKSALSSSSIVAQSTYYIQHTTDTTYRSGNVWIISASINNQYAANRAYLTKLLPPPTSKTFSFTETTTLQDINRFASEISGYHIYGSTSYSLVVRYIYI